MSVEIPKDYNLAVSLNPISPFDVDLDAEHSGGFDAKHSGSLEAKMSGSLDLDTNNVVTLKGDPNAPVYTDSKIDLLNLPHFTLQDIKDMMKVRMRIPNYSNICFKAFGMEVFSICVSGEGQVITEPYIPNAAERCETDCCEPDTRPFPDQKGNDNVLKNTVEEKK
ncbi:MAG: hypothetical protein H7Y01_15150 [Ferruginibacter sp.]|nr:hypothetical protein [Chitinophagaceae bacterium]